MALAFHRYPTLDLHGPPTYREAAKRNIEGARSKLLRAASQLESAQRTEAAHRVRLSLLALDDALDEC